MSFLGLLDRILNSKYKDLFTVRLGVSLTLSKLGVVGVAAKMAAPFLAGTIGLLMEVGVFKIDLWIDSIKEGMLLEEFKAEATKLYEQVTKKVHSEAEKQKIREEYLRLIGKFSAI